MLSTNSVVIHFVSKAISSTSVLPEIKNKTCFHKKAGDNTSAYFALLSSYSNKVIRIFKGKSLLDTYAKNCNNVKACIWHKLSRMRHKI